MRLNSKNILEQLYKTGILVDIEGSKQYKELLHKYNQFYQQIEDEELKKKFNKLEEMKNELYSQNSQDIFKVGYAIATKSLTEALNTKT